MKTFWPRALFEKFAPANFRGKLTFWFLSKSSRRLMATLMRAYGSKGGVAGESQN